MRATLSLTSILAAVAAAFPVQNGERMAFFQHMTGF